MTSALVEVVVSVWHMSLLGAMLRPANSLAWVRGLLQRLRTDTGAPICPSCAG